jgi:putative SOS response-associated peptidase YedK
VCGRFTLRAPASVLAEQFAVYDVSPIGPRFNVAPTQPVAAVRLAPPPGDAQRQLVALRWGLIPGWAKDAAIGNRMINARAETVAEKPAYRSSFRRRRCLILADGFYEWQKTGGQKQPYFIHMCDDRPFAFAGLWEAWHGPDDCPIESCALITTEPNDLVGPIHNRMPVILRPEDHDLWLDASIQQPERLQPLLRPYPPEEMDAYPVTTFVNSPANDHPRCIEPSG